MVDGADYQKAHREIRKAKGAAFAHVCVDCEDRQARDWAFRGDAGLIDPTCGKVYSTDPDDYVPVCRRCHVRSDGRDEIGRNNLASFNSPEFREQKAAIGKKVSSEVNSRRRRCLGCGVVYHPGGMGVHQKATGHKGFITVERGKRKR